MTYLYRNIIRRLDNITNNILDLSDWFNKEYNNCLDNLNDKFNIINSNLNNGFEIINVSLDNLNDKFNIINSNLNNGFEIINVSLDNLNDKYDTKINELDTEIQNQQNKFASVSHTHKIFNNDLTVNGTIEAKKLKSNTMTFEAIDERTGKCSIDGTDIFVIQKNSWMHIFKILNLSHSLVVDENITVRNDLNVKTSFKFKGWIMYDKIKEFEEMLHNHYQVLTLILNKLDMADTVQVLGASFIPPGSL